MERGCRGWRAMEGPESAIGQEPVWRGPRNQCGGKEPGAKRRAGCRSKGLLLTFGPFPKVSRRKGGRVTLRRWFEWICPRFRYRLLVLWFCYLRAYPFTMVTFSHPFALTATPFWKGPKGSKRPPVGMTHPHGLQISSLT